MLKRVLIANRGEIALRILRACRELDIETVAVYSQADEEAIHVQLATQSVRIGPPRAADSYLNQDAILTVAKGTGCDGIHPGYGFLSENADFADACAAAGVTFIGPSGDSIRKAGSKSAARDIMRAAGVPVTPGSEGVVRDLAAAQAAAEAIGYPVLLKASAGGGGRGIRKVLSPDELEGAILAAKQEAGSFFGSDGIYLEKFIENPRHVEIQILCDRQGNAVHLGERDCSMQRRNQKVLEECPSPAVDEPLRQRMGEAAVKAALAVGYEGAGTIEFLLDRSGHFYFMEMNTRIQVEHPITEAVTGVDLVKQQILIADGHPLPFAQKDIEMRGHAIECRINAENPALDFRPSPGKIEGLYLPGGPGIRIDSAVYAGYTIPPYYDSMIGKLIAFAPTRKEAIAKMKWALAEFLVDGVDTNIEFQLQLIGTPEFQSGEYDNGYLMSGRFQYQP